MGPAPSISEYHAASVPGIGSKPASPPTVTRSGFATTRGSDSFAAAVRSVFISSMGVSAEVNARSLSLSPAPFTHSVPCASRKSTAPTRSRKDAASTVTRPSMPSSATGPRVDHVKCKHRSPSSPNASSSESFSGFSPSRGVSVSASLSEPAAASSSVELDRVSFRALSRACVISPLVMTPSNQSGSNPSFSSFFNVPEARRLLLEMMKRRAPDSHNRRVVSIAHGYAVLPS